MITIFNLIGGFGGGGSNPYVTNINPSGLGVKRQNVAFAATDSANTTGTFDWSYLQNEIEEANYTTRAINATLTELGMHDLLITVSRTNALDRYLARAVSSMPAPFTEGEADVVFDLTAVGAGTFSNPLGDASVAGNGTTNFAYDFNDVVRAGLKIYVKGSYSGRINFIGLRGTLASPVRIQCDTAARATFTSTNASQPYAWQFTTGNQYILIDGSACLVSNYGFLLEGYKASATAGQILFFSGSSQKGFEITGVECNGRKNDGDSSATGGGAAIQFQPPTPDAGQNASNYSQEYIKVHNCYIHDNFGEGLYVGYFSDAEQAGFRPDRMGDVYIYDNIIERCHRDGVQVSSSNYCEIFRNTISHTGEEANASHISGISWNDGNLTSYIYNNHVTETDLFISGQNGSTGTGNYYIFCNYAKQRDTILAGTGNQFAYLAVDNADCDYHFFNNTLICPDVSVAPVAIQHNNLAGGFECLNFTFAGNVISTGGTDQAIWPELRRVNTPADTSNWFIDNTWVRTASEATLELDVDGKPDARTSPAYGSGFDWSVRFVGVDFFGGQRDLEGFVLKTGNSPATGLGFTSGAYANHPIWIPDTTAPTISASSTSNVTATGFDINVTTDENAIHYFVVVANGDTIPSKTQIIAGQNAAGSAAIDSGSAIGKTTVQAASGLTASTAYDVHIVAVDGSSNQSAIDSEDVTTGASTTQVELNEIGATSGVVGETQRASLGTLTPALPVGAGFAAGDLLVCMVSIRASGGTSDISGWTQIGTHRMGSTSNGEFYIWGKIADGTESGSITVTFPNDFAVTKMARCFRFKYNNTASVAAAIESLATAQGTSTTYAAANVTSTVNLALAVQFVAVADDNVTGSMTGESGADYTEAATYVYTGGTGGAHSVQTAVKATAGAITGGSYVMAASDPWGVIGLIIKP